MNRNYHASASAISANNDGKVATPATTSSDWTHSSNAEYLVGRCMESFGWDEALAQRILMEYVRFGRLKIQQKDERTQRMVPPDLVRLMWQLHFADFVNYERDMWNCFGPGRFLWFNDIDMRHVTTLIERIKSTKLAISTMEAETDEHCNEDIWSFDDILRENHSVPSPKGVLNTNDDPNRCANCPELLFGGRQIEDIRVQHMCCGISFCRSCSEDPALYDKISDRCLPCKTAGISGVGFMKKQAKRGLPWAQFFLGLECRSGNKVAQSDYDAMRWFRKASSKGHPKATIAIARLCQSGKGCFKDLGKAMECAFQAKIMGPRLPAISHIADDLICLVANELMCNDKHDEAALHLFSSAEHGCIQARHDLAYYLKYYLSEPSMALALARIQFI